jgi:hypothetical protein
MRQKEAYIETSDLSLAAALLAMGIAPNPTQPYAKTKSVHGERYRFFFNDTSECGSYSTMKLINAWEDDQFCVNEPEHPFSYIKAAFQNREGLLDTINKHPGYVVVEKNGKMAIISKNASEEFQQKIFSQL